MKTLLQILIGAVMIFILLLLLDDFMVAFPAMYDGSAVQTLRSDFTDTMRTLWPATNAI